jgi:hypothetical protein
MSNPFDYVKEILQTKNDIIVDEQSEKDYNPYIVNRSLSYHQDCVYFANEMNMRHHLDKKLQYSFLLNTVRSKKRSFAKWIKPVESEDLECIKFVYGYSDSKAKEVLNLLSKEQIQKIKEQTEIGGLKGQKNG